MIRVAFGLLSLVLAASGLSMTLQFSNRWNGATIVNSRFSVADANGSRFIFGGYADNDAYIALTDQLGNVLAARRWDSVGGGEDRVVDVEIDSDGTVTVLALAEGRGVLLGYNGDALAPTYEVSLGEVDDENCALFRHNAGGPTYVAQKNGASMQLRQFDGSGTPIWERTFAQTDPYVRDLAGGPSGGIVYAGTTGYRGFARHYDQSGTQEWTYTTNSDNDVSNVIQSIFVEADGSMVGIGTNNATGAGLLGAAFFRVSAQGTAAAVDISGIAGLGLSIVKRGPNLYYGLAGVSLDRSVYSFDRNTNVITPLSSMTGVGSELAIDSGSNRYYVNNFSFSNPLSSASRVFVSNNSVTNFYAEGFQMFDFAAAPGSLVAGAGSRNRNAAYTLFHTNGSPQIFEKEVLGYTERKVAGVAHDPNGAAYVGSTYSNPGGGAESTLTKFAANGSVLWYRNLSLSGGRFRIQKVLRTADGDVVVVGTDEGNARMHARKLDGTTGTLLWSRSYFVAGGDILFADAAIGLNGAVYLASTVTGFGPALVSVKRMDGATGLQLSENYYSHNNADVIDKIQVQATGGGLLVTSRHGMDAEAKAVHVIMSPELDILLTNVYNGVAVTIRTKRAANGDVVLGYLDDTGLATVLRFNPGTYVTETSGTLSNRAIPLFVDSGANGNIVVYSGHSGGGYRVAGVSASNGSQLWDTVVEPTVNSLTGISMDNANNAFILAEEPQGNGIQSLYTARYLSNGVRSAQRRIAGDATFVTNPTAGQVWLFGAAPTRNQAKQITFTRYNY